MSAALRPAAFLDRDGALKVDTGDPHYPDSVVGPFNIAQDYRELDRAYLIS